MYIRYQFGGSKPTYTYAMSKSYMIERKIEKMGTLFLQKALKKRDFQSIGKTWGSADLYLGIYSVSKTNWEDIKNTYKMFNYIKWCSLLSNKTEIAKYGTKIGDNFPYTFVIDQYTDMSDISKFDYWIIKPRGGSSGIGIQVMHTDDLLQMKFQKTFIVQRYIERPLLINGYKFDFRMYLLYHNDKLYLYERYYIRLTRKKYTLLDLDNSIHLTNISTGGERKSDLYFKTYHNINMFNKVQTGLIKLFDLIPKQKSDFYQLSGFDVMLDYQYNLYFIEFNLVPGMNKDSDESINKIKKNLMDDVLRLTIDKVFPNTYKTKRKNDFKLLKDYG